MPIIRVYDTIHSADNNTAGQQTLTNYPTQRKNERFVKHRDYPPHSYIVNERYNSRNKRASQEKKTINGINRQLAQSGKTLTQEGHEIASSKHEKELHPWRFELEICPSQLPCAAHSHRPDFHVWLLVCL